MYRVKVVSRSKRGRRRSRTVKRFDNLALAIRYAEEIRAPDVEIWDTSSEFGDELEWRKLRYSVSVARRILGTYREIERFGQLDDAVAYAGALRSRPVRVIDAYIGKVVWLLGEEMKGPEEEAEYLESLRSRLRSGPGEKRLGPRDAT